MSDTFYRTVNGFVYAGPYERDANGKKVRDIYVSYPVMGKEDEVVPDQPVRVTVWPDHEDVDIAIGDYIIANGSYEIYPAQNKDGEYENKHSLSASKFANMGNGLGNKAPRGSKVPDVPKKRDPGKIEF